jgi:hypothetical protein
MLGVVGLWLIGAVLLGMLFGKIALWAWGGRDDDDWDD